MNKNAALLDESDLRAWLKLQRRADIERWLRENGVAFRHAKGEVVTTLEAVNKAIANGAAFGDIEFGAPANGS